MNTKDVLHEYNKCKSLRETAKKLEISEGVVRKSLISYGIIDSPLIRRIAELRRTGMPQKDIADLLGISSSCVNANTPYERGTYKGDVKSKNAERIADSRRRKRERND